ncbi:VP5 [Kummerowia striata gokushovirus]|nr:VP5 [Kummerowia striata gokushovirus]
MKTNAYAIFDKKTLQYGQPFFQQNDGTALRSFVNEVNRPSENNPIYMNPEDFSLVRIGSWDNEDGTLDGLRPETIAEAQKYKKETK